MMDTGRGLIYLFTLGVITWLFPGCNTTPVGNLPTTVAEATVEVPASPIPSRTAGDTPAPTATLAHPTATATDTLMPTPTVTSTPTPTQTPMPTPCAEPGRVESRAFPSPTAGGDHRYSIYLPPCYAIDGRTYPVLYLLAGNIHDETKWDELGIDEAAEQAINAGEAPPILIVMSNGGWLADETSGGPGSYETLILNELIPHVESNYCAWAEPAGRAIGGLSRGGYWALEIAFRSPQLFASAGGHSAALLDSFAGPTVNPQYTALSNDLGNLRIYLDIGSADHVRANTIRLHEEMQAAGVPHEWHLNEGAHVDAYWVQNVPDYLTWYVAPWSQDRMTYPLCILTP